MIERIGFKSKQAIVITDTNNPDIDSYKIVIDNQFLLKDVERLTVVLSVLLDFILKKEYKEATQSFVKATDMLKVKSMLKAFESQLGKIKVTFSYGGAKKDLEMSVFAEEDERRLRYWLSNNSTKLH
ncbi:MAG TPA: hypothetical protein VFI73_05795 [Candidatus Nitrosopolaris sp.]|nr:hypothetical protein [Candidatus Nitrosopolaris sp.]